MTASASPDGPHTKKAQPLPLMTTPASSLNNRSSSNQSAGEFEINGQLVDFHYGVACVAMEQRDFETAASESLASIARTPLQPAAHYLAGVALIHLGRIDEAEAALLTAVEQQPLYPAAHLALAHLYQRYRQDFFRLGEHRVLAAKAARLLGQTPGSPVTAAC
jgi:tetratricopeptide (TPR) repeat protein